MLCDYHVREGGELSIELERASRCNLEGYGGANYPRHGAAIKAEGGGAVDVDAEVDGGGLVVIVRIGHGRVGSLFAKAKGSVEIRQIGSPDVEIGAVFAKKFTRISPC